MVDEQGVMIDPPIATCELQAYLYAGLQQAALAFFAAGDRAYALELVAKARRLRRHVDEIFWVQDQDLYAMALGPDKTPLRSMSSNPGHLLAAGIVPREKAKKVATRLLEPDRYSGWGIRTLSAAHPTYNPFSYHRGSVWPVENGTIALGLARSGPRPLRALGRAAQARGRDLRAHSAVPGGPATRIDRRSASRRGASPSRDLPEEL
jgi:glycogen debranching enzyme